MNRLLQNEDCTVIFGTQRFPKGKAGEVIDQYVDVIAGAGVTELFCNTNCRCTNYRSDVWEAFWGGYDPKGPDDQPFLASVAKDSVAGLRMLFDNMLATHADGVDYPARVIQRCRQHGIVPWISLRMNDVHETDNPQHPFHGTFWKSNPQLRRQGAKDWSGFRSAYDYAHKEVRDHYRALIVETLERYDMDGLELDFMREPYLFSVGQEADGGRILTTWMREIRGLVEADARRRGRRIKLGVRVPSHVETALGLGLDAVTWGREGLVDLIVVANRWATIEFDMPIQAWRERLGPFKGTLAGGIDTSVRSHPYAGTCRYVFTDPAGHRYARGAAMSILSGGADAVYLFNYYQRDFQPVGGATVYQQFMKSLASMELLKKEPRTHAVTFREILAPDEVYRAPLPATGQELSFALPLGTRPDDGWSVDVILEHEAMSIMGCALPIEPPQPIPEVRLNRALCSLRAQATGKEGRRVLTYKASASAVGGDNRDRVEIESAKGEITLLRLEVTMAPAGRGRE